MTISNMASALGHLTEITLRLPNGKIVPPHFHLTELGKITRQFVDCGGTLRTRNSANLQLWVAEDYEHRLTPRKLSNIIRTTSKHFDLDELEVEIEYQGNTIEKYGLALIGDEFQLIELHTDCLAKDSCGIPAAKVSASSPCCSTPGAC